MMITRIHFRRVDTHVAVQLLSSMESTYIAQLTD